MTDEAMSPLRRRMIEDTLSVAYGAGLRATEVISLKVSDIDSKRMLIRVEQGNSRLIVFDQQGVTFKWKNYRLKGRDRYQQMTLATDEFIRRFLIHVLPPGFHRIRHYGLFAKSAGVDNIARARQLLDGQKSQAEPADADQPNGNDSPTGAQSYPYCGGRLIIIETFARGTTPRYRPAAPSSAVRIDTS